MAAINAITFNEGKQFYQRKLEQGKSMSAINAVRFKLICRIFSVVKEVASSKMIIQKNSLKIAGGTIEFRKPLVMRCFCCRSCSN
jgi:hypothetical protein